MNNSRPFDLLVAGEINPDLILSDPNLNPQFGQAETLVKNLELTIGSSSVIFACGAARLGLKVAFTGIIGKDMFGQYMLEAMQARGVDTRGVIVDPGIRTGMSVILNRGTDRAILTYPGAISCLRIEQIPESLLAESRHLHIASYFLQTELQPSLPDLFQRAHKLGLTTSLDPNWDPSGNWQGLIDLLPLIDIFLPNENEALALTKSRSIEQAAEWLSSRCQVVVIKRGSQGAFARSGNHTASCPALKVTIADTVGAGDSFDAGFIYSFLQGWSLDHSLLLAAACGSLSTRAFGGTAAQPTISEATSAIRQEKYENSPFK
ncbi:MAG TPA: carbohydrate kinase family protein [Anaerolineaceae bacterium]